MGPIRRTEVGRKVGELAQAADLTVRTLHAVLAKATAQGAKVMFPIMDQPYGDREVTIIDPFGIVWFVATHIHD